MVVFSAEKKPGKKMIIDEVIISRLVIFNFSFPFSFQGFFCYLTECQSDTPCACPHEHAHPCG